MNFKKIFVAGSSGMVGSALVRELSKIRKNNIVTSSKYNLDFTNQLNKNNFFRKNQFDEIYIAAAKVGGIKANANFSAEFIYQNLMIQNNIIKSAFDNRVKKLLFLGSSCIYPKNSSYPIKEKSLLSGHLEKTNEAYAIAKISGVKMCEAFNKQYGKKYGIDYRVAMPCNLYGPGDNFDINNSHVIPALIIKFHNAVKYKKKIVKILGTGKPLREFLYVDDLATACIKYMNTSNIMLKKLNHNYCYINIGSQQNISIKNLSNKIARLTNYKGKIIFSSSQYDGVKNKVMDSSTIRKIGWNPKIKLNEGLALAYSNYLNS